MSGEHTFGASDDIVRRIRENLPHIEWEQPLSAERERLAADEIERLRAERDDHKARLAVEAVTAPDADFDTMMDSLQARLRDLHAEIERLRAAGDAMAKTLDALCHSYCGSDDDADLVDAWREARRG